MMWTTNSGKVRSFLNKSCKRRKLVHHFFCGRCKIVHHIHPHHTAESDFFCVSGHLYFCYFDLDHLFFQSLVTPLTLWTCITKSLECFSKLWFIPNVKGLDFDQYRLKADISTAMLWINGSITSLLFVEVLDITGVPLWILLSWWLVYNLSRCWSTTSDLIYDRHKHLIISDQQNAA